MSDVNTQLSNRLRDARVNAGLSQGQVARMLGYHRPTISQIEAGERQVKASEVSRFAEIYEVRESWLLRGDDALLDMSAPELRVAARELSKLKQEDFEALVKLVRTLRETRKGGE